MECMCAQIRLRFTLSSERVFWGNGVRTHVNSKGKILSTGENRLVGLVVKASASRAEDPGFESRWSRDFFGVESYQ